MCSQKLKDRHLLAWIVGLVALDVLFLIIWATVDPLHRTLVSLPPQVGSDGDDDDGDDDDDSDGGKWW